MRGLINESFQNHEESANTQGCIDSGNQNTGRKKTVTASSKVVTENYLSIICIVWKRGYIYKRTIYCNLSKENLELSLIIILFSERHHK